MPYMRTTVAHARLAITTTACNHNEMMYLLSIKSYLIQEGITNHSLEREPRGALDII